MIRKIFAMGVLGALVTGCASGPEFRADFDRSADFFGYRTYAFVNPLGTDRKGYSSLITNHFKTAVAREMEARGYTPVQSNPDLLVNFSASAQDRTDVQATPSMSMSMGYYGYRGGMYGTYPMYGGTDVQTIRYKYGTANVDVVDAKRNQLVWEGVVEGKLTDEFLQDPGPRISEVVTEIFTRYPATAGTAVPAAAAK